MDESTDILPEGQCSTCVYWDHFGTHRDLMGCPQPCTAEQKVRDSFDSEEDWIDHMSADDCPVYEDNQIKEAV